MSTAPVADIRRLTVHDGPGVRNTVFLKGCPLRCLWCHNPESISAEVQLLFNEKKCSFCQKCASVCPQGVHLFCEGKHLIQREKCTSCGKCAEDCLANALEIKGKMMSSSFVFEQLMRDRSFFRYGGGVTLSGGEPALYPEFSRDLFERLRTAGIHTALDTCGAVPFENFEMILPFTDLLLFDLKGMDPVRHRNNTGQDNHLILKNLSLIDGKGIPVEIRMPIVPGYNDFPDEIAAAGDFLSQLTSVVKVRLLPYHSLARNKYLFCGVPDTMPDVPPPGQEKLSGIADILKSRGIRETVF